MEALVTDKILALQKLKAKVLYRLRVVILRHGHSAYFSGRRNYMLYSGYKLNKIKSGVPQGLSLGHLLLILNCNAQI